MAAPHAAGVAALIIAENPNYTPYDVRAALINTAKDRGLLAGTSFMALAW